MINCIITQVHIPEFDVQGNLSEQEKLTIVDFGLQHLRYFNPESYIILSGHGKIPNNAGLCNHVIWNHRSEKLNDYGYVEGMPAQYKYVSAGIEHAIDKGFTKCLKTRGDCVIGIPGITKYADDILEKENKQLLITQQTGDDRLGDCFMYGDIGILNRTWHHNNQVMHEDGLQNTAYHFSRAMGETSTNWRDLVTKYCSFRDVDKLKFMCLRWNYRDINLNDCLDPGYNFENYHWGKTNNWVWRDSGVLHVNHNYIWTEADFYRNK